MDVVEKFMSGHLWEFEGERYQDLFLVTIYEHYEKGKEPMKECLNEKLEI